MAEKFILKSGIHYERNPNWVSKEDSKGTSPTVRYSATENNIVESDRPLDKLYENKFEKLIPGMNAPVVVTDARRQEVTQLLALGNWKETDRDFLEGLSEKDFQRVVSRSEGMAAKKPAEKVVSALGEDVTATFPSAHDAGLKVFANAAGKHQLTVGTATKPVNPRPLDADKVADFIEKYQKEKGS